LALRVLEQLVVSDGLAAIESPVVPLRADYVSEVRWWEHPGFAERATLEAAALVAIDVLDPPLRGRSRIAAQVAALYDDELFRGRMRALVLAEPTGRVDLPTLAHALDRLASIERRLGELEHRSSSGPVTAYDARDDGHVPLRAFGAGVRIARAADGRAVTPPRRSRRWFWGSFRERSDS
jgi:hypothetical protein